MIGPFLQCSCWLQTALCVLSCVVCNAITSCKALFHYACTDTCFAVQLLLIDKHHLHVWDLTRDCFVARKRISQQPLLAIFKSSGRCEYGVVSATAVDIWRVDQDLDYCIVLGGHMGPVIAVHAVNGALVHSLLALPEVWQYACLSLLTPAGHLHIHDDLHVMQL